MSHLHLGVPASVLTEEEFYTVAQFMEARIVLSRAESFAENANPMEYASSNFTNLGRGRRGVLKAEMNV